jgi:catechol 2,3-dioxygenase-like lactoylglutathione lyase family enzyme
MLDHVSIQRAEVRASAALYGAVLAPLGGVRIMELGEEIGHGTRATPESWIGPQLTGTRLRESHLAFAARDRASVKLFFDAAFTLGAEVLHAPRLSRVARSGRVFRP